MAYFCANVWILTSCPSTSCGICIETHVPPNGTADLTTVDKQLFISFKDGRPLVWRPTQDQVCKCDWKDNFWLHVAADLEFLCFISQIFVFVAMSCKIPRLSFSAICINLLVCKRKHPMLKDHKGSRSHHLMEWNLNEFEDMKGKRSQDVPFAAIRHADSILRVLKSVSNYLLQIANLRLLQTSSFWTAWLLDGLVRWSFQGTSLQDRQSIFSPRTTTETKAVNNKIPGNYCSSWRLRMGCAG